MTFTNKDIHLVDFSFYLHRSYHVMKNMKVNINGFEKPTGHIKGVLDYIKRIKEYNKDAIIFLCLDDLPIHKMKLLESVGVIYKDGRAKNEYNIKQDTDLICNLAYLIPGVYTAFCEGEEADDIISTLCYKYKKDNKIFIHSSDKDLVQLLDKQCYIITEWDNATPIKTTLDTYKTSEKYEKAFLNCVPHKLTYYRTIYMNNVTVRIEITEEDMKTLDTKGVGALLEMSMEKGKKVNPALVGGVCGEHGGDPDSVKFCHKIGLNYVSCSPFRIPQAKLAAAQAVLENK